MNKQKFCHVPHCKSVRTGTVTHVFPKDRIRGLQWLSIIHKRDVDLDEDAYREYLQPGCFVCHKHFSDRCKNRYTFFQYYKFTINFVYLKKNC